MLKKLQTTGHQTAVSKSAIKQMRMSIINESKFSQQQISVFWSKKAKVMSYKMKAVDDKKCQHVVVDKQSHFVFIQEKTFPTLKLIHSYPDMYPRFTVDPGALKFVLKGANIMCPGLTNQHGSMDEVQQKAIVSIYAKGLQHAIGIGISQMSTQQIKQKNEGIAVQLVHYIGDAFWNLLYVQKDNNKEK